MTLKKFAAAGALALSAIGIASPALAHTGGPRKIIAPVSTGNFGIANGTQVIAPISIPVNICGVAIEALNIVPIGSPTTAICRKGQFVGY